MPAPSATYDISSHPLLSQSGKKLHEDHLNVFNAEVDAAGYVLKLAGTDFTGDRAERAKLALVYQVNFQLSRPKDADFYKSRKAGERTNQYRDALPAINTQAQIIASELLADDEQISTRQSKTVNVNKTVTW